MNPLSPLLLFLVVLSVVSLPFLLACRDAHTLLALCAVLHLLLYTGVTWAAIVFFRRLDLGHQEHRIVAVPHRKAEKMYEDLCPSLFSFLVQLGMRTFLPLLAVYFVLSYNRLLRTEILLVDWIKSLVVAVIATDFWYWFLHGCLHFPLLYRIHRVHHRHRNPVIVSEFHASILEDLMFDKPTEHLGWITVVFCGLPVHPCLVIVLQWLLLLDQLNAHSGYDLPWWPDKALPSIIPSARFHFFHHYENKGSFGVFLCVFDRMFGSFNVFQPFDSE